MKEAKRFKIILLVCVILLGGCANKEREYTTEEQNIIDEVNDTLRDAYLIDGFQNATFEYERYNSYASQNGLGDTLIYIEGEVLNQTKHDSEPPVVNIIVEQEDGNRWCVGIWSDSEIIEIQDKNIRAYGMYMGFSDVFNVPAMAVAVEDEKLMDKARIEVEENGNLVEAWNFYNDYIKLEIDKLNNSDESSSESQNNETKSTITTGQENALKSAKDYLGFNAFSYEGLIEQLEYEKYSHEDAVYAADNCGANWDEQALKSAKNYLSFSAFSYSGLVRQLEHEKFTTEQATYAVDNCGADWNEQAAKSAENYLSMMSFSKDGLIEQLEYEGFTHEQAAYGAEQNGY